MPGLPGSARLAGLPALAGLNDGLAGGWVGWAGSAQLAGLAWLTAWLGWLTAWLGRLGRQSSSISLGWSYIDVLKALLRSQIFRSS